MYYANNPYNLQSSPTEPRLKGFFNLSRNSSLSKDYTETSSQRSSKIVRANGLRLV